MKRLGRTCCPGVFPHERRDLSVIYVHLCRSHERLQICICLRLSNGFQCNQLGLEDYIPFLVEHTINRVCLLDLGAAWSRHVGAELKAINWTSMYVLTVQELHTHTHTHHPVCVFVCVFRLEMKAPGESVCQDVSLADG